MHNYIWGFHCRVTPEGFARLSNRFVFQFKEQPDLVKLSPHYDAVAILATFEVISESPIDIGSISYMKEYLERENIGHATFDNYSKNLPHQAIFVVLKVSDVYDPHPTRVLFANWFGHGRILRDGIHDLGDNVFLFTVVAADILPDQLVRHLYSVIEDGTEYYRRLIK